MPKKKEIDMPTLLDNPATEDIQSKDKIKTQEDIDSQIALNHQKINEYHRTISHAQNEVDSLKTMKEHRERAISRKQKLLEDAKKALQDTKSYSSFASQSHTSVVAIEQEVRQHGINALASDITILNDNHAKATQKDDARINELTSSINEHNTLIAELENSNASLHLQKRNMNNAEGQQLYQELDKKVQGCKERLNSILSAEKAARDAYESTRQELAELVSSSLPKLSNWPELQAKLKRDNVYNDAPIRVLDAYIRLLQIIMHEAKAINDHTGIPTYSLLSSLSIERNELEMLSNGYEAPFRLQEKQERAKAYLAQLKKQ